MISASSCATAGGNAISGSLWWRTSWADCGFAASSRLPRLRDDGADQVGNQLAHQFRAAPGVIEIGIMLVDLGDDVGGQRHDLEIVDAEQPGPQAVVDVVGVIGDVVGEGRDLRLQRGKAP